MSTKMAAFNDASVSDSDVTAFLIRLLSSLPGVDSFTLLEIAGATSVEHRPGVGPEMTGLADEARALRGPSDSFTETLLGLAVSRGLARQAVVAAQFHQPLSAAVRVHELRLEQLTHGHLVDLCENVPLGRILVLSSRVRTRGGIAHIPMLDFKLPANESNERVVKATAAALGPGSVLNSGSSYHFYGRRLVREDELFDWLLRAQLLGRYVDGRWVTHQLIERQCALRISAKSKSGIRPQVLAESVGWGP